MPTIKLDLSRADFDEIANAAAAKDQAVEEWAEGVLLWAARLVNSPEKEGEEEPEAGPDLAEVLARLSALEREARLGRAWAETVYAELVAHTAFASPEQEKACRLRADRQLERMRPAVLAYAAGEAG